MNPSAMYNPWQQGCAPPPENALVMNPSVPFWGPIAGGMEVGKMIEISGHIPFVADRFVINLSAGPDQGREADRPLHISVRFDELAVVRNTMQNEWWGAEERDGGFPFSPGKEFSVIILNEVNCFRIAINGEHYAEYAHRLPSASITMLNVQGTVTLTKIAFTGRGPSLPQGSISAPTLNPVMNQSTPITYPIHGGLFPGKMMYISGRPTGDDRFSINLQCGTASYPTPDIAFHFDVRFFNTTVVRNSLINDFWGEEELSIPYFPCQPGVNFDMIIRVEQDKFLVAFNGQHFIEYRHRLLPLSKIDTLSILKDVFITSIGVV